MVTGIETVSVVLAILPLVINQLNNYVQGLDTLHSLFSRRYRREIECYANALSTQHVIFQNAQVRMLHDVVDREKDIFSMIINSDHPFWHDNEIISNIKSRLGSSYNVYVSTAENLAQQLKYLHEKMPTGKHPTTGMNYRSKTFKDEAKMITIFLRKPIYEAVLGQIEHANGILRTLYEDIVWRENCRKSNKGKKAVLFYRRTRISVMSSYRLLVQKCLNCLRHRHFLNLCLQPQFYNSSAIIMDNQPGESDISLITNGLKTMEPINDHLEWKGVFLEAELRDSLSVHIPNSASSTMTQASLRPYANHVTEITLAEKLDLNSKASVELESTLTDDLCSMIQRVGTSQCSQYIGSIPYNAFLDRGFSVYLIRVVDRQPEVTTLANLLETTMTQHRNWQDSIISRRDRLAIAAGLASMTLVFHGNWLHPGWSSKDVGLLNFGVDGSSDPHLLYFSHEVLSPEDLQSQSTSLCTKLVHPLIRSPTLFPLGLILVELALCQPLSTLRKPEDGEPGQAVTDLTIATRLLPTVLGQEGVRFHDVVARCLNWCGPEDKGLEDETFQKAVFEMVVQPLHEILKVFDERT